LTTDWKALKRVLAYLASTKDLALPFRFCETMRIRTYSDSDWASCLDTRRSVTGSLVFLDKNLVDWTSRRQKHVTLSSTEAEISAGSETAVSALFIQKLLFSLIAEHVPFEMPIDSKMDNQSAIAISSSETSLKRSRHIDCRDLFLQELVTQGKAKVSYVNTNENLADLLTKALPSARFKYLRDQLIVIYPDGRSFNPSSSKRQKTEF
jgi:hypothetical protein